jgi:hypothetical protein
VGGEGRQSENLSLFSLHALGDESEGEKFTYLPQGTFSLYKYL